MLKRLRQRKSLEDAIADIQHGEKGGMKKSLGAMSLVMLGIGAVIGAGIFVITGEASANYAGPAIVLSFALSGLACVFAGLCYAEFAAMIPISGSAYTYAYITMGEFMAWVIGWNLILEYLFAASTVAVSWSGYVTNFFSENLHIHLPPSLTSAPFNHTLKEGWVMTGSYVNLPAILIVVVVTWLLVVGIKESANFNNVIVILKVTVILLFIIFGISYINLDNWKPFIPPNTGISGEFGWSGILRGAGVIFFAYIGFDAVSTAAQESKNPQRDMPIGIMISLVVCTILYILFSLVLTGIVHYTKLNVPNPVAIAIDSTGAGMHWLSPFIKLGAIAGLSSVVLVLLMAQPRIFFSMSKDGLLPEMFSKLHPKYQTPYISTLICGLVAAVIAGLFPISVLGKLVSIGTLAAFAMVCIGVLVLRYQHPNIHRPFKTPFMPYVPILGAFFAVLQMVGLPQDTWIRLLIWMTIGLIVYFTYSWNNSKLHKEGKRKKE